MFEMIAFAVGFLAIWLFLLKLRVPAFLLFFSLLVGQILTTEISGGVYSILVSASGQQDFKYVQLALLLTPFVLTILFMQRKTPRGKFIAEALPMLLTISVLAIFAYPLVPAIHSVLDQITDYKVETYKNVIIAVSAITHLFTTWHSYLNNKKTSKKHKDKSANDVFS